LSLICASVAWSADRAVFAFVFFALGTVAALHAAAPGPGTDILHWRAFGLQEQPAAQRVTSPARLIAPTATGPSPAPAVYLVLFRRRGFVRCAIVRGRCAGNLDPEERSCMSFGISRNGCRMVCSCRMGKVDNLG
jgi:hypothetical protein